MKNILHNLYRLQALDIQGLPADRSEADSLRAGIPAGMLNNYDRARARGRKGIAILRNNVCTNCRMQSPIAVSIALRSGAVQICGNCGLYLCLDPEASATPAPETVVVTKPRRPRKVAMVKGS